MKKLPQEILVIVFSNLHLSFKQECMLVCRQWANVLRSTSLYNSIVISKTETFNRLVQILQDNPHIREQVNELILLGNVSSDMNEIQFYKLFFNLRSIHFGYGVKMKRLGYAQNYGRSVSLKRWSDQIQTVKVHNFSKFVYTLLTPSVCSSLTALSIGPKHFNEDFIVRLTNAPKLKSLSVFKCQVSTSHLEQVHAAVQNLQSLQLIHATLIVDNDVDQVHAANSLEAVDIRFTNTAVDTILPWLQYISLKYANISAFGFVHNGYFSHGVSDESTMIESGILPALQKLCHLKFFQTNCSTSIATLLNVIDKSNSTIEDLSLIGRYRNAEDPTMMVPINYRLITELILQIDSTKWLRVLKHMEFIKSLEVHFQHLISLDINELIKQCPTTMESLMIKGFNIVCKDQSHRFHQLNVLRIDSKGITKEAYCCISNSFPNLRHLELGYQILTKKPIMLDKLILYSLRITINQKDASFLIRTLNNNTTQFYTTSYGLEAFRNYDSTNTYDVIKPMSSPPLQNADTLTQFVFGSVKTLFINKHLAY